ncbi:MFS transporter [Candidatus Peregrinibacteria bacterium]|nr:MFS transporter [Candidatus Peregrinibacteria bacterium]
MTKEISKSYAIYALIIIFFANFFNYVDRFLVSAVLHRIDVDFGLSGFKEGFLWTAFTLGYMLSAPFIGYLSDRRSRTKIFAFCVFVWSLATIASGLSAMFGSYALLVISRILIGVGEAGCLIIGPPLIADYFPAHIRGRMLSIFFLGLPLGSIGGYLLGGLVKENWPLAFYIGGAPGFIIAILILLLYEPQRGQSEGAGSHSLPPANLKSYLEFFKTKTLLYIIFAQAAGTFTFIPLVHFGKIYLIEERKMGDNESAIILGVAIFVGALGNIVGGWLGDKLYKKTKSAYSLLAAIGYLCGFAFTVLALLSPDEMIYIVTTLTAFFFFLACMPLVNTQIANVTSPEKRAVAFAITVFILHLLGDTISPIFFGVAKDHWGLQKSFLAFTLPLLISGVLCFFAARYAKSEAK